LKAETTTSLWALWACCAQYPALKQHGTPEFIRNRFLRLGLPFAVAVTLWIPVAYYAMWQLTGMDTGYWNYYKHVAARGFIVGPPWFVWLLLLFDVLLARVACRAAAAGHGAVDGAARQAPGGDVYRAVLFVSDCVSAAAGAVWVWGMGEPDYFAVFVSDVAGGIICAVVRAGVSGGDSGTGRGAAGARWGTGAALEAVAGGVHRGV
jgi:hypothetical protein